MGETSEGGLETTGLVPCSFARLGKIRVLSASTIQRLARDGPSSSADSRYGARERLSTAHIQSALRTVTSAYLVRSDHAPIGR